MPTVLNRFDTATACYLLRAAWVVEIAATFVPDVCIHTPQR